MSESSERWVRVKAVFDAAVAVESSERAAYVVRACGGNEDLRREVEAHENTEPGEDSTPKRCPSIRLLDATPWPVMAMRPTMIHEEGRAARSPRLLTDERG